MDIKRILELGYYPVPPSDIGEGAQIVNGQWYMPRWGCDTLQHIIDTWQIPSNTPLHVEKKRRCHICNVEIGEKHLPFCSAGNSVFSH